MNIEATRKAFEKEFPVPENVRWNPDWCGQGRYEPDNALLNPDAADEAFRHHQRWIGWQAARAQGEGEAVEWRINKLAEILHYPDCWDTMAYPDLASAVWEVVSGSGCSICRNAHPSASVPDVGDFARLYRFDDLGQVLVMLDLNPDDEEREAEIRFHFDPKVEALGVCSAAMCFEGTDADEKAKRSFSRLTEADIKLFAGETVRKTRSIFSELGAEDDD